jgi:ATP-dependent Clp protease adaptor protein ClpS
MSNIASKPRTKVRLKTERPRLHKVILVNDDYTPREFVVTVLKVEFHMSEDQAFRVMMTAHGSPRACRRARVLSHDHR